MPPTAEVVLRVAAGSLSDRLGLSGRPATAGDGVPGSGEAVTSQWLSSALCRNVPGAQITGLEITGGSDGTSSRRAISVTYNEAGRDGGLPTRVFTKTSTAFSTRMLLGVTGITEGEALFFNALRPEVELRSPSAHYAACDPTTCRSIVVLEDLAHAGWTFPDPMNNPIAERDAIDMIDQMAAYHAAFWDGRTAATALARLQTPLAIQQRLNRAALFPKRTLVGLERARHLVPAGIWQRRDELWPAVMRSLQLSLRGPQTLLHQDVHIGNWLRDPDGRMGLYDWQILGRGHWAIDVSYALVVGLDTDDRRSWERDLLNQYVTALSEHGVANPPTAAEAYAHYRRHPMHAYAFGLFTNGQPRYLPELQPADYTERSIQRITVALQDLATLDALAD
jgi:Phosphotransferase enzyme family